MAAVVIAVARCEALPAQEYSACETPGAARLREAVLDRVTGVTLRNANVTVSWRSDNSPRQLSSRTDSTGRVGFCIPAPQEVVIRVVYRNIESGAGRLVLDTAATVAHTTVLDVPHVYVQGQVIDHLTEAPVMNAAVRLAHSTLDVLTGPDGRFAFARVPVGDYDLRVDHPSYASTSTRLSASSSDLRAIFRVTPEPVALPAVRVSVYSRHLEGVGFYDREKRGVGTFIGRQQIDGARAQFASDLLRSVPGVRLIAATPRRGAPRSFTTARGNCRFRFVVDGTRVLPDFELDNILPMHIEGIEVYAGLAQVPAQFRAQVADGAAATCGVIAVWTRDGR